MTEPTMNSLDHSQSLHITPVTSAKAIHSIIINKTGPETSVGHLYGPKKLVVFSFLLILAYTT